MAKRKTRSSDAQGPSSVLHRKEQEKLVAVVEGTLEFFAEAADAARAKLADERPPSPSVFASMNTLTTDKALQNLSVMADERRCDLEKLSSEPAIARIVVLTDEDEAETYFISRATPHGVSSRGVKVASYRSPIGRLAALRVGSYLEVRTPRAARYLEVTERATLRPKLIRKQWDSVDSTIETIDSRAQTIISFRALLRSLGEPDDKGDLLESLLAEDRRAGNVFEGLRRSIITKMGLRDQPLLDEYQDEIFRLPLDSRLVILGPPGSGKTTTLIKRLGLKLDTEYLEKGEQDLVGRTVAGHKEHGQSWQMFTPTELLKQYVKEAFAREDIAASDLRIQTWADYRRELARNRLGVLRTSTGGSFVLKDELRSLQEATPIHSKAWFADFDGWQRSSFWTELALHARKLADDAGASVAKLGKSLATIVDGTTDGVSAAPFIAMAVVAEDVQGLISTLKSDTDTRVHRAFSRELNRDNKLLDRLMDFITTLGDSAEDLDDPDSEEEEEEVRVSHLDRKAAFDAYGRAVRALARAEVSTRSLGRQSRNSKVIKWLDGRVPPTEELRALGLSLQVQTSARRFVNPLRRYIEGVPLRYRRFRRERHGEGRWYQPDGFSQTELAPLEVDVILLAMLRATGGLLQDQRILRGIALPRHAILRTVRQLYRTQIVVDEVTDFSPIQLGCMAALCDPVARSFLACGDFNQRVTEWGCRSRDDLKWVFQDIDVRSINITYRHSRQLNEFARRLVLVSDPDASEAELPPDVENEGVEPVLARNLVGTESVADWLAARIVEIERITQTLPSIAVLVNGDDEIGPVAAALNVALSGQNIRAVACPGGQVVGQENDVRVFDVQHIKGLEFEAVFFLGIDRLAEQAPELFDKYLYVGATRAAMYLGLTITGSNLPSKIAGLESSFQKRWL